MTGDRSVPIAFVGHGFAFPIIARCHACPGTGERPGPVGQGSFAYFRRPAPGGGRARRMIPITQVAGSATGF
jgi:hypothetical protein